MRVQKKQAHKVAMSLRRGYQSKTKPIVKQRNANIETHRVVKYEKMNKAPRLDDIPAELIKSIDPWIAIHNLILSISNQEQITQKWSKTVICPIPKKDDKLTFENYRGISLACTFYKI